MTDTLTLLLVSIMLLLVAYLVIKLPRSNSSKLSERPIFVDTSVLIDGRIIAVAESGFIGDTLVIPKSVVRELQYLADKADHDKRARARYGLDIITKLQAIEAVRVEIFQDGAHKAGGVDERLLELAKKHNGAVCTIDFNLNKVAATEKITVLNVNQLAQSLRMAYLPGEHMRLELVQKGQDSHQAVGYLSDGTMVVVEQAVSLIGTTADIEFIRSLQTAAGKMMFAKLIIASQVSATHVSANQNQKPSLKPKQVIKSFVAGRAGGKKPFLKPSNNNSESTTNDGPKSFDDDNNSYNNSNGNNTNNKQVNKPNKSRQAQSEDQPAVKAVAHFQPRQNQNVKRPQSRQRSKRPDIEASLIELVEKSQEDNK